MGALRNTKNINMVVIHCSATPDGHFVDAQEIDRWHKTRGFTRNMDLAPYHAPQLQHIGYHFLIYTTGPMVLGRPVTETGAHVSGHNSHTIGICLIGTEKYTPRQWQSLRDTVTWLRTDYPAITKVVGHRDLSPDIDGDGEIGPHEWLKTCPGFSVADWLKRDMQPLTGHILEEAPANMPIMFYLVKPGDSLSKIANELKVSIADIKHWNNLDSDKIIAGQKLTITVEGKSHE